MIVLMGGLPRSGGRWLSGRMPEVMIVPDDINTRNWCRTVEREGIWDLRWLVRRGVSREDAKARRAGGERGESAAPAGAVVFCCVRPAADAAG
jgi:hypothetical protein